MNIVVKKGKLDIIIRKLRMEGNKKLGIIVTRRMEK